MTLGADFVPVFLDIAVGPDEERASDDAEERFAEELFHAANAVGFDGVEIGIAEKVEITTGKNWRQDAYTGEALQHALEALVRHFASHGTRVIPPKIEEATARMLPEATERDRSPSGVGEMEAFKVITMIEHFGGWDTRSMVMSDELYRYMQILRDLGSGAERTQTALQEAQAALQEKERRR